MKKISIVYGSTTGNTENAALAIAAALGAEAVNVASASAADFDAELLILGSSTWGVGDLQDDWAGAIDQLDRIDLGGRKAAVFGTGDQSGFGDSYCSALAVLAAKLQERGATLIGQTSTDGYSFNASDAVRDGKFVGLALDEDNQPEQTAGRIAAWVAVLKKEAGM